MKICEGRITKTVGGTEGQVIYNADGLRFGAVIKVNNKTKVRIHCNDLKTINALKETLDECWFT